MRAIRLFALAAALSGAAATNAGAVEARLAPDGSITTWLLAPPYPLDPKAGFAKDLLPRETGETRAVRRAEGRGPVRWRGEAFPRTFIDLGKRCLRRGESVFYAACEIRAAKTGKYTLTTTYWPQIAVWLDGRPVLRGGPDPGAFIPRASAEIALERNRPRQLLVKLCSRGRQAMFQLRLLARESDPNKGPAPAPVTCILRVPAARTGDLLAGALELRSPGGDLLRAGRPVALTLSAPAGRPLLRGRAAVSGVIADHTGRTVHALPEVRQDASKLLTKGVRIAWRMPKNSAARYYTVTARVSYLGRPAGEWRRVLYPTEGLTTWLKALRKRIRDAGRQLGARRYRQPDYAFARLKQEKAVLYARANEFGGFDARRFVEELEACGRALARIEARRPRPTVPGLSEHAYLSDIDDSPQPYYLYVPKAHDGRRALPCIVYLHGYTPDLDKLNWAQFPEALLDYCDRFGYYFVAPFGRSNTDFQGIGEADVLHVLRLARERLPIDPDRVFLVGYSMGAMGALTIGAHYPHLWAGIVSVSGRSDYYLWKDLDRARVEPYKRRLLDAEFGAEMAGNYRNVPVLLFHGSADSLVKVEQSRRLRRRLRRLGADVTLREFPGRDHWIMSDVLLDDTVFRWMAKRKRTPWPREVDFTTYTIKYRRAYWVTVLELVRWGRPVHVRATLSKDRSRLDVTTTNVATLQLDLDRKLVGDAPRLTVRIDGKDHAVTRPGPATFVVRTIRKPAGKLRKTPRLCGPVKEAYGDRFLIVFGTDRKNEGDRERVRRLLTPALREWHQFAKAPPLLRQDAALTPADLARSNLILYGTPADNATLRAIADKLPIRITKDGFVFPALGGRPARTFSNQTHGLVMIYPNPLNPARYVVVRSGRPYGGRLSSNHKLDLLPDFVIFREGTDYDDTDQAVVAGFFDENWRLCDRLTWRRGKKDPDPRRDEPAK